MVDLVSGINRKIPNEVAQRTTRVRLLDPAVVPSVNEATEMYTRQGGTITTESTFGVDLLVRESYS